ncbi:hypothetical protein ZWY2020_001573 [Hordeum vulgare]|nr:hypothetical protein ZWY2020_001573 [Hordeum vulgare]
MAMELRRSSSFFARSGHKSSRRPALDPASRRRLADPIWIEDPYRQCRLTPLTSPALLDLTEEGQSRGMAGSMQAFFQKKHVLHRSLIRACSPPPGVRTAGGRAMASRRALAATGVSETKDGGVCIEEDGRQRRGRSRVSAYRSGCGGEAAVRFEGRTGCDRAASLRPTWGEHSTIDASKYLLFIAWKKAKAAVVLRIWSPSSLFLTQKLQYTRSQSCPFCRGSLKRVQSRDLWVLTGDDNVIDPVTVEKENVRHFHSFIDSLPLTVPDNLLLRAAGVQQPRAPPRWRCAVGAASLTSGRGRRGGGWPRSRTRCSAYVSGSAPSIPPRTRRAPTTRRRALCAGTTHAPTSPPARRRGEGQVEQKPATCHGQGGRGQIVVGCGAGVAGQFALAAVFRDREWQQPALSPQLPLGCRAEAEAVHVAANAVQPSFVVPRRTEAAPPSVTAGGAGDDVWVADVLELDGGGDTSAEKAFKVSSSVIVPSKFGAAPESFGLDGF